MNERMAVAIGGPGGARQCVVQGMRSAATAETFCVHLPHDSNKTVSLEKTHRVGRVANMGSWDQISADIGGRKQLHG